MEAGKKASWAWRCPKSSAAAAAILISGTTPSSGRTACRARGPGRPHLGHQRGPPRGGRSDGSAGCQERRAVRYDLGPDGVGQDFAGGKIFYSPSTGAHVVTGQVLAKYESVGGPLGDLGFPTSSEADGGLKPASRMSTFAAADRPVIFWTPDHGAVIVRGAMNAAWAKLGGATGELGAPRSGSDRERRCHHPEVHRWRGLLGLLDESLQHRSAEPGVLAGGPRGAGSGAAPNSRHPIGVRYRRRQLAFAMVVATGRRSGAARAGVVAGAAGSWTWRRGSIRAAG